jgi:Fic family protein
MPWNWQQPDWPTFTWRPERLHRAEELFLRGGGVMVGAAEHLADADREQIAVAGLVDEALTTSEIEGELLDRASVQASVRRQLGLRADARRAGPAEQGVAEMMVALARSTAEPLSHDMLHAWHAVLMRGRRNIQRIGAYRDHDEPMQIVSGRLDAPRVHFEAPPSARVPAEMSAFLAWFDRTRPDGDEPLPALTRAGIAHLHFESVHPFEDGNGRIGRAISEKALAQGLDGPVFTGLAPAMLRRRRQYYDMLEVSTRRNDIDDWVAWFAGVALEAQHRTQARIAFLIDCTRLLDQLRGTLNDRQERVLRRTLAAGPEGFEGGLSASNYQRIARTSPATASRDLADLVAKGAMTRTGERRHTRYHPAIPLRPAVTVTIAADGRVVTEGATPDPPAAPERGRSS